MSQEKIRDRLRKKYPTMARRAKATSRADAIKLFCRECMGGQEHMVAGCTVTDCFLYPYRVSTRSVRLKGVS